MRTHGYVDASPANCSSGRSIARWAANTSARRMLCGHLDIDVDHILDVDQVVRC